MRSFRIWTVAALALVCAVPAYAESNALAIGVEKVTKAPFAMMKGGNEHLFSPVKDVNHAALTMVDEVRAATVSAGLNFGQPVEG